jgi:ribonuclease E
VAAAGAGAALTPTSDAEASIDETAEGMEAQASDASLDADSAEGRRRRRRRGGRGRGGEARPAGDMQGEIFEQPHDVPHDSGTEARGDDRDLRAGHADAGMSNGHPASATNGDDRVRAERVDAPAIDERAHAAPAVDPHERWPDQPRTERMVDEPPLDVAQDRRFERAAAQPAAAPAATSSLLRSAPPPVEPFVLPTDSLRGVAEGAGLTWVVSDADKVRAVQDAMAREPQATHVPRAPRAAVVVDEGPLILVETKKDLSGLFEAR